MSDDEYGGGGGGGGGDFDDDGPGYKQLRPSSTSLTIGKKKLYQV